MLGLNARPGRLHDLDQKVAWYTQPLTPVHSVDLNCRHPSKKRKRKVYPYPPSHCQKICAPHCNMKIISRTEAGGVPRNYKVTKGLKISQTAAPTDNTKSSIREEVDNANKILAACNRSIATSATGSRIQHQAVVTKGLKKTRRPSINTRNAPIASKKKSAGISTAVKKIVPVKSENNKQTETREAEEDASQKIAPTDKTKSSIREEVENANKVLAAAVAQSQGSATPSSASSLVPSLASSQASSVSSLSSCHVDACIVAIFDIRQWIRDM